MMQPTENGDEIGGYDDAAGSRADFRLAGEKLEVQERTLRLRKAVRAAGGNQSVAARSGIPVRTLNNYLAGRDMRAESLIALAKATRVSVAWLAAGEDQPVQAPNPSKSYEASTSSSPVAQNTDLQGKTAVRGHPSTFNAAVRVPAANSDRPQPPFGGLDVEVLATALRLAELLVELRRRRPEGTDYARLIAALYSVVLQIQAEEENPDNDPSAILKKAAELLRNSGDL